MKKTLYFSILAAIALTSCSNQQDMIFDQSAADRLEQYKKDYAEVLTDNGGLWSMEYFSNPEEEGYVFVMQFSKDGSVNISANHKWIDDAFKQERSKWVMIADNGPVLSFNSYNTLFHIFSDPANILGPNAPTGDSGDIDETGFGHEGDYEFQVMGVSDDKNTIRLLGKKRMYNIYMHRLDPATDVEEYLDQIKNVPSRFSKTFNNLVMTDADGNKYRLMDLYTGIPSIYPLDGDAVMQTVSGNGIFSLESFRFMEPLEVKKADDSVFDVTELFFNEDGTLSGENVADVRAQSALENVIRQDLTWTIDKESMTGKVKSLYDEANAQIIAALSAKDVLGDIDLTYASNAGRIVPQLVTRLGTRVCRDYIEYSLDYDDNGNLILSDNLHFVITGGNTTAVRYDGQIAAYKEFKDYLTGNFTMVVNNPMVPDVITLSDVTDSTSSFNLKLK